MAMTRTGGEPLRVGEAHPIAAPDRIAALDVLRGIALLGVMAINVVKEFRVSIFQQFLTDQIGGGWYDRAVHATLMIGVDMKALAIFSMLFGAGLAIQFDQLSGHPRRAALLMRRLFVLLLIGVAHLLLLWNGDILVEYAMAGFVVLAFLYGSRQQCALVGLSLLAVYVAVPSMVQLPSKTWMAYAVAEANRIYATGTFPEVLGIGIRELPGILPLHLSVFPRTLGLMLSVLPWHVQAFRSVSKTGRRLPYVAGIGIPLGVCMLLAHASGAMLGSWQALLSLERLATIIVALGYCAAIVWIVGQPRWDKWLTWARPLGRMAFTDYLAQSVIFGLVFYGY